MGNVRRRLSIAYACVGAVLGWFAPWVVELILRGRLRCHLANAQIDERVTCAILMSLALAFAAQVSWREVQGPKRYRSTAAAVVVSCGSVGIIAGLLLTGGTRAFGCGAAGILVGLLSLPWVLLVVAGINGIEQARRASLIAGAPRAALALSLITGGLLLPWWGSPRPEPALSVVVMLSLGAATIAAHVLVVRRRIDWVSASFGKLSVDDGDQPSAPARLEIDLGIGERARPLRQGGHPYRGGGQIAAVCRGSIAEARKAVRLLLGFCGVIFAAGTVQVSILATRIYLEPLIAQPIWCSDLHL